MRRDFLLTFFLLFAITLNLSAQNTEMDPNDPDSIFTTANHPTDPPLGADWDVVKKWGHQELLSWKPYNYGYKSYIFRGMAFRLKFPRSYQHGVNDGKKYPVYIFFHGLGSPGPIWDNEKGMSGGDLHAKAADRGDYDGFIIYPQAQKDVYGGWFFGYAGRIAALIEKLRDEVKADEDRVVISGLSSGGAGTWYFMQNYPEKVAAIMPISAAWEYTTVMDWAPSVITIPVWLSNGGQDKSPKPFDVEQMVNAYNYYGGNLRQSFYPELSHNTWSRFWAEPDHFKFMREAHKAQPLVRFGKTEFCAGESVNVTLKLFPGFYEYQWQKDGETIIGADKDSLVVTTFGEYRARFKRTSSSEWSDWSPRPVDIKLKAGVAPPQILVEPGHSRVVPAPNGDITTPLILSEGYTSYDWRRVSDNSQVGTQYKYNAA